MAWRMKAMSSRTLTGTAAAAGMTLVAVARSDGFETFSAPHRVEQTEAKVEPHVA